MPNKLPLYTPTVKEQADIQRLMKQIKDITKLPYWHNLVRALELYLERSRDDKNNK